jgi:hypothetical protein
LTWDRAASVTISERRFFATNRDGIQYILTECNNLSDSIPGFFDDERHIQQHFEWVAQKTIVESIKNQIAPQFKYLLLVLRCWIPTEDFEQKLESATLKSGLMNGSPVPLRVCLLRELTYHWEKTRSGLIRFHDEEENDGSPRIVCTQENDSMQFAIDAENGVVLKDLSFNDAIAAFYHFTFAANMQYPKNGESVAVWWQRTVASIVDTGTSQLISCLRIPGRILIRSVFTDLLDPDPYSERKLYYFMKTSLKCFILTIRISILMRIPKI